MKDIYLEIVRVLGSGTPAALATIVQVMESSPRGGGQSSLSQRTDLPLALSGEDALRLKYGKVPWIQ